MSDTPTEPKPEAVATPTPSTPEVPAPAPTPAPEPSPSRWTNLAIAVAVVTVGGFIAGRATSTVPAQPATLRPVALDVAPTAKRLPLDVLHRLRVPMRRLNLPPGVVQARGPHAAMGNADPSARPGRGEKPAVAQALGAVEPKVESCVSALPEHSARAVIVRYAVHRDGADGTIREAKMVYPRGADAQVEQCVADAVKGVRVPGFAEDTVGVHAFPGR